MTSLAVPVVRFADLLRALDFAGDAPSVAGGGFRFAIDFDSSLAFPDLPLDSASAESRYDADARPALGALLAAAADGLRRAAPRAFDFVDRETDRVLVRRTDAIASATSSSNRDHVGVCVLTNMHLAAEPTLSCVEALVHEAIHQHLYRLESAQGPLCSLDASRRFRSPWSGNRIPLHSFVHACFVYFGLLGLWSRYAVAATSPADIAFVQDRIARSLFGFAFVGRILEDPAFPLASVDPAIVALIRRMAATTPDAGIAADEARTFAEALDADAAAAWPMRVASVVARVGDSRAAA
jgi:hypothetical protein